MRALKLLIVVVSLVGLVLPLWSQPVSTVEEKALATARQTSNDLVSKLRAALLEEISKGGTTGAVKVCTEIAQEIPRQFNQQPGQFVRRVSLGYRNIKDRPDKFERAKLQQFAQLNREKNLAADYSEVFSEKGKRYLRYMKPLIAGAMCIQCHGPKDRVAEPIRKIIAEKYPQDRAFGYQEGDVRGAVSVKILLPNR